MSETAKQVLLILQSIEFKDEDWLDPLTTILTVTQNTPRLVFSGISYSGLSYSAGYDELRGTSYLPYLSLSSDWPETLSEVLSDLRYILTAICSPKDYTAYYKTQHNNSRLVIELCEVNKYNLVFINCPSLTKRSAGVRMGSWLGTEVRLHALMWILAYYVRYKIRYFPEWSYSCAPL